MNGKKKNQPGVEAVGYRAPCFGVNDDIIDLLKDLGLKYDSSALNYTNAPGSKTLSLNNFSDTFFYAAKQVCGFYPAAFYIVDKCAPFGVKYIKKVAPDGKKRFDVIRRNTMYEYIENFKKLGFGLFVHFGLYSLEGKGEWYLHLNSKADKEKYNKSVNRFFIKPNWAKNLVKTAKKAGCKYITLTTRHHDGFSLYDTKGLNDFDAPHSACGRDLIKEFVDACNEENIVPFFYHTLLDWHNPDYKDNFPKYIDYLIKSVEILCSNYGKIGGLWFDGMWEKPNEDWQEDRLYGTIRKYQPEAMIINNTGLNELGKTGHKEIDSVTFERGKPCPVDTSEKPIAGEMCQVLNDHWGYCKEDCNYKSVKELIENLIDCRKFGCNFLLNTGLKGDGMVNETDKCLLSELGKWVKVNKKFVYEARPTDFKTDDFDILTDGKQYYAVMKNVGMSADPNVAINENLRSVAMPFNIKNAKWLDDGKKIKVENGNSFIVTPYEYGRSYSARVAVITPIKSTSKNKKSLESHKNGQNRD
ncbi:MAG: alpha-L-fucosidase [Christensenellaceae bacterium]|nr:alpha-L-fucosidase [Christensenellaceae bacterium]